MTSHDGTCRKIVHDERESLHTSNTMREQATHLGGRTALGTPQGEEMWAIRERGLKDVKHAFETPASWDRQQCKKLFHTRDED